MSTTLGCGVPTINPAQSNSCNEGNIEGIYFSYVEQSSVTAETLKLAETMDDMQADLLDAGRIIALKFDKETTAIATETTFENTNDGEPMETNRQVKPGEYEIFASPCTAAALLQNKQQKTCYAYLSYNTGLLKGKKTSTGNVKQFRCSIGFREIPGTLSTVAKIGVTLWREEMTGNEITIQPEYTLQDRVALNAKSINFTEIAKSLTSLTVAAKDICGNPITTLGTTTPQFVLYNTTTGVQITVTGVTLTNGNYVLAFTAQTATNGSKLYYTAPSVNLERVEVLEVNSLTGTLTA